ncbi:MAG TPA: hypothetical protein VMT52_02840, partial [Planctomycetota bacterium]|nr:hypothetical protein [Planctomycetota bacterium]
MTRHIASLAALLWVTGVAPQGFAGDLPLIDDDFDEAPCCTRDEFDAGECELGWICQGSTVWIPPDANECDPLDPNTFNPEDPCTLFPEEGYVLVTPAVGNMNGNMFRTERILYDNFKLTAEVELRDGSIGRPADGMTIVIVGTEDPPPLGAAGGAMGSTGLGAVPTMIFEFDNWNCNTGDNNDQNHVQFAYSKTGFPAVDSIPIRPAPFQGVFKPVDETLYPLNNRQPPPAESNRFLFEVIVQKGTVACFLTNDDVGLDRTSFYVFTIPGFEPFEGYLGVTASTGGAWQNQILHSIKIEEFDGCLAPAAIAMRDLKPTRNPEDNSGDYQAGDVIDVDITLSQIRAADANCSAAAGVILRETPPAGWTPSAISDGGSFNAGTGEISWTLTGASFTNGKKVSYKATAPDAPEFSAMFTGTATENIALSESTGIFGEDTLVKDADFDDCGGI